MGILLASCIISTAIRAIAAREETVPQTIEVLSRTELSPDKLLVRLAPPRQEAEALAVESVTRYPFGLAVVKSGGTGRAPRPAARAVPVRTARLTPGRVDRRVVAFGTVEAEHDARVALEVPGVVRRVRFVLGQRVAEGDPLVELDARDAQLRLRRAEAELTRARAAALRAEGGVAHLDSQCVTARASLEVRARDLERWAGLAARDLASRDRADQADAQWRAALLEAQRLDQGADDARAVAREAAAALDLALAARDQAQLDLDRCVLRAPFAGVVAERLVQEGQWGQAGTAAARLVAADRVRVRVHVREEEGLAVRPGAPAHVLLPGVSAPPPYGDAAARLPGQGDAAGPFPARVEGVAAAADPRDRTFAVDVAAEAAGGLLRPGMFARVVLDLGVIEHALLVPDGAVVAEAGAHHVFLADGDRARRVAVTLGPRQGEGRLLRAGLDGACEVVVEGTGLLFDGAPLARLGD
ncbi:MAG: efflux RND transporter periplasmic adaptor subunit [Planctomycetes bacterium]|nr:efflux RND transporter periplasmic adaptor subunit [Planctomycetota bacterium]